MYCRFPELNREIQHLIQHAPLVIVDLCFLEFYDPENAKKRKKTVETDETLILGDPSQFSQKLTVEMKKRNSKNSRKLQKPGNLAGNCCQILCVISMPLEPVGVSFPVSGFQVSRNPENLAENI